MPPYPSRADFEQRLASPDWTVTDAGLAATADIECGNATDIETTGPVSISVAPLEDDVPVQMQIQGPISAYSMCVLTENRSDRPAELELEVRVPAWLIDHGFDYFLRKRYMTSSLDVAAPRPALDCKLLTSDRQRDGADTVSVTIPLAPHEQRVISTTARYPYSTCCERLAELATRHPSAQLVEIGQSVQGRPIIALEAGNRSAPRAVFTGTLQPGEQSAWAVTAMAEAVLGEDARWLDDYHLSFVPQTNPDGIVLGLCNVNALDELAAFGFEEATVGAACPAEVKALWGYLAASPPVVYVDFHFLRQPDHDRPKTYFFAPEIYDDAARAEKAIALNARLLALSGAAHPYGVEVGHELWRGLSSYQAAAALDAVSFLYQYTGPTTSHTEARTRGPQVMREALEVCLGLS